MQQFKTAPGVINAGEIYTLPEFKARTGFGEAALRTARRSGLPILRIGSRGFVRGSDVIKYLDRIAQQEAR